MPSARRQPNFLVIVADDLGYSDTGPFGSEIQTPALDRLAKTGVRLTNFHTASACSPTRSMLFSGTDNHIAGLGQLVEHMANDSYRSQPGYEGYLNFRVAALSEILQDAGYETFMSGKWHLGLTKETCPAARGFDKSFVFLSGCHNHFNYEPQLDNPQHGLFTPMNGGKFWMEDDRILDRTTEIPRDFYSSDSFADRLIDYLKDRQDQEKPFFAYLPFTAPHWPLQAPQDVIKKYKGIYDDGPAALRQKRLAALIKLGLISPAVKSAPLADSRLAGWEDMSEAERAGSAKRMEVYAAMVEVMDRAIGRVIDHLEAVDQLDNTFVVFMSDNGAEGAMLEALPIMGGSHSIQQIMDKYYDNSLENVGNADSFVWYGPEWASASMAPSRGFKTWITEGGIRCPCIVRYPQLANSSNGGHTDSFATVMDVLPTILDLAGVPSPGKHFRGREVVPVRGASWKPHLSGGATGFHHEEEEITGWELFGQRAIRQGHWKAIWQTAPRGTETWELYDLRHDPGELHNLAKQEPAILEKLVEHWEEYYAQTGMFDPGHEFGYVKYA